MLSSPSTTNTGIVTFHSESCMPSSHCGFPGLSHCMYAFSSFPRFVKLRPGMVHAIRSIPPRARIYAPPIVIVCAQDLLVRTATYRTYVSSSILPLSPLKALRRQRLSSRLQHRHPHRKHRCCRHARFLDCGQLPLSRMLDFPLSRRRSSGLGPGPLFRGERHLHMI